MVRQQNIEYVYEGQEVTYITVDCLETALESKVTKIPR